LQAQFARQNYRSILRQFADNSGQSAFGVHQIVREAHALGLTPGQWFGPQFVSIVLRNLNDKIRPYPDFKIVVCTDGNIFLDEIKA
jgi:hypothetical protein